MTPEEIRAAYREFLADYARLSEELEDLRYQWKGIARKCKHPQGKSYTERDGSNGLSCPDCGGD